MLAMLFPPLIAAKNWPGNSVADGGRDKVDNGALDAEKELAQTRLRPCLIGCWRAEFPGEVAALVGLGARPHHRGVKRYPRRRQESTEGAADPPDRAVARALALACRKSGRVLSLRSRVRRPGRAGAA
jgi:hypothetical protein